MKDPKLEENETKKKKKMNLVLSKIRNGREILGIDRNTGTEHAIGSIITLIGSTRSEKSILVPAFQKLRGKYETKASCFILSMSTLRRGGLEWAALSMFSK